MARLKKRDDGLYQKQVLAGKKADGSYIRRTVYAKTQKELEEKTDQAKKTLQYGGYLLSGATTFGELAEIWMKSFGGTQSEKWRYRMQSLLNKHLLPSLGQMKIKDIRQFHIQILINEKGEKGYATATIKQMKQTAIRILEVACAGDVIKNEFSKIKVPKKDPNEREVLTEEQIMMVNQTWDTHFMGYPAMIMLYCGLRRGELLALTWKDVDLEHGFITISKAVEIITNQPRIKKPKSKAGIRSIPIPTLLSDVLSQVKGADNELVCPASQGTVMSNSAYCSAWNSYMNHLNLYYGGATGTRSNNKEVVIPRFTAQMLRHTYATLLYDAGVDVKSAQRYLGHANLELTLKVYTHLTKYKEGKSMENYNKLLKEKGFIEKATNR